MSFINANIIDVAFNTVAGRGRHACLAWIAYRVYTDVLIRIAENGKIRYDLFAAIALCPNAIRTFGTAVAAVSSTQNLWTEFMLVWTMLAMSYVLAYPTLVSAAASLVAPDSGAVAVAGRVGTPTVAVYPLIRDLRLQIARWAPWAAWWWPRRFARR